MRQQAAATTPITHSASPMPGGYNGGSFMMGCNVVICVLSIDNDLKMSRLPLSTGLFRTPCRRGLQEL